MLYGHTQSTGFIRHSISTARPIFLIFATIVVRVISALCDFGTGVPTEVVRGFKPHHDILRFFFELYVLNRPTVWYNGNHHYSNFLLINPTFAAGVRQILCMHSI